jgi:hypothetical protein
MAQCHVYALWFFPKRKKVKIVPNIKWYTMRNNVLKPVTEAGTEYGFGKP